MVRGCEYSKWFQGELRDLEEKYKNKIIEDVNRSDDTVTLFAEFREFKIYEKVYAHCSLFTHCDAAILDRYLIEMED